MDYRNFLRVVPALWLTFSTAPATASEWGCQVLLCLANPGSPTQYAECVPPITKLWKELSKVPPNPFPTCDLADGNDGSSRAEQVYDMFDNCPAETSPIAAGTVLAEGNRNATPAAGGWYLDITNFDLSQQEQTAPSDVCDNEASCNVWENRAPRACVGQFVGSYHAGGFGSGDDGGYNVNVYKKVVWQHPQSPRAIDVYVDNELYKRIHW